MPLEITIDSRSRSVKASDRLFLEVSAIRGAAPDEVATIRGDALASIGYITNWAFIFEDASYFEQVGRPSPLLQG